ncbi:retrovirus-related pol polyprotein from transposon TNT 1-94 [Tanacetum coccineum]
MESYYIACIKYGPFIPKNVEDLLKPEAQWTPDERKVVNQDQRLKSLIISCLPDDIIKLVINCETTKDTWTDLVHVHEVPSNTMETRIMDLKLEYNTFRAKESESLVAETYDWDEEEVTSNDDDDMVEAKVLMALSEYKRMDVGKIHARNGEWVNIIIRKLKEEKRINEKWLNSSDKVSQCINDQIPNQKKRILGLDQLTETSLIGEETENAFFPTLMVFDHEMITKSKDWVQRKIENQNDTKVKQMRTNNGTEFKNHSLERFYDIKGISQNFTSPYTPELNGVVERRNRTLIEASKTMLNDSVLPKHF